MPFDGFEDKMAKSNEHVIQFTKLNCKVCNIEYFECPEYFVLGSIGGTSWWGEISDFMLLIIPCANHCQTTHHRSLKENYHTWVEDSIFDNNRGV